MVNNILKRSAWLVVCGSLAFAGAAVAEDRSADEILAEIKAVKMPTRPAELTDQAVAQKFATAQRAAVQKKTELIGELYKVDPENAELPGLLPIRWQNLRTSSSTLPTLRAETAAIIAKSQDQRLVAEAYYSSAYGSIYFGDRANMLKEYEAFATKCPKDARVPSLLYVVASRTSDFTEKENLFQRIEKEFPKTTTAKQVASARKRAEGERKKLERVGKPFELEFTDAIKGTQISMASLKGKVVVVDFWATWCGPCIAEIPNMKKIYAEYKDKGVEFIGVSLDQPKEKGGLDNLKDYVAKNAVEWPQYYQGNYWDSEFSASWGINAIPCVFLIDADGNLATIDARGKLEELLPEYLEKAKGKKTAANP